MDYGRQWRTTVRQFCRYAATAHGRAGFLGASLDTHGQFVVRQDGEFLTLLFYNVKLSIITSVPEDSGTLSYRLTFSDLHTTRVNDATEVSIWGRCDPGDLFFEVLDHLNENNTDTQTFLIWNAQNLLTDIRSSVDDFLHSLA